MLLAEILMAGPEVPRRGRAVRVDVFSSTVQRRRPDGTALFTEKFLIEPGRGAVRDVGVLGGFDVLANVMVVTPPAAAAAVLEQVVPSIGGELADGASRLPNDAGLVYRVLGMETDPVRHKVRAFWDLVRRTVVGASVPPEFLWR